MFASKYCMHIYFMLMFTVAASCHQKHYRRGSTLHWVRLYLPGCDLRSVCFLQLAGPIMPQLPWAKVNHDCWGCDLCVSIFFCTVENIRVECRSSFLFGGA